MQVPAFYWLLLHLNSTYYFYSVLLFLFLMVNNSHDFFFSCNQDILMFSCNWKKNQSRYFHPSLTTTSIFYNMAKEDI